MLKFKKKIDRFVWYPPEIRHQDLSPYYELSEEQIPLREKRQYEELKYKLQNKEDINFDDEYIKKIKAQYEEETKCPPEILEKAEKNKNRLFPTRKYKKRAEEHFKEAQQWLSQFPMDIF